MSKQKVILLVLALALIGSSAAMLKRMKSHQRLGAPGIKTEPIAGSENLRVLLPETVLTYGSEEIKQEAIVTNTLPRDTSYGQRRYINKETNNDWLLMNVVLMGADRTSLHKPEFCLQGAGWRIDGGATAETKIPMSLPQQYELPVIKMIGTRTIQHTNGEPVTVRGIYVYWFVADGVLSGNRSGFERMRWMAKHLLQTGELQRWAYVSCFAVCLPGQEDATYERMKNFLVAAVPEFQLTPKPDVKLTTNP